MLFYLLAAGLVKTCAWLERLESCFGVVGRKTANKKKSPFKREWYAEKRYNSNEIWGRWC